MDAHDWDQRYAESELVWSATPNRFVADELADLAPGDAVDLAAGEGRNAIWLAERGWRVTAVDFSAAGLAKGRAILARHEHAQQLAVEWVHADVLDYDPAPQRFDLAVLAYLQLPAEQRRRAVRRAFSMLRDGGTLFVVAHDSTNLTEGTGGPQDASVLYTAEDVLADLDGERFEVLRADRVERRVAAAADAATHAHEGRAELIAYDALVRVVRTDPS